MLAVAPVNRFGTNQVCQRPVAANHLLDAPLTARAVHFPFSNSASSVFPGLQTGRARRAAFGNEPASYWERCATERAFRARSSGPPFEGG